MQAIRIIGMVIEALGTILGTLALILAVALALYSTGLAAEPSKSDKTATVEQYSLAPIPSDSRELWEKNATLCGAYFFIAEPRQGGYVYFLPAGSRKYRGVHPVNVKPDLAEAKHVSPFAEEVVQKNDEVLGIKVKLPLQEYERWCLPKMPPAIPKQPKKSGKK